MEWSALLRDLRDADARGDVNQARELLLEAVEQRLAGRAAGMIGNLSRVEAMLWLRLSSELARQQKSGAAYDVLLALREESRAGGNHYFFHLATFRMVSTCLAELRAKEALALLGELLHGDLVANPEAAIERAASLNVPNVADNDLHDLRAGTLYALARLLAFHGSLCTAADALDRALALLRERESGYLDAAEIALFAAEIRVDSGEFDSVTRLRNSVIVAMDAEAKWQVLRAYVFRLRGDLSRAESALRDVLAARYAVGEAITTAASRMRIDTLAILNRLDDASSALRALDENDDATRQLKRLIAARRALEDEIAQTPRSAIGYRRAVEEAAAPPHEIAEGRRYERVRDEWTRRAQEVQLALHDGDLRAAQLHFAMLAEWCTSIDSPLIAAEFESLYARVAYISGDPRTAGAHAADAAARFRALGMPLHERESLHLQISAIRRANAGDADAMRAEVARLLGRAATLVTEVESRLTSTDLRMFRLNKWDAADLEMESICDRARDDGRPMWEALSAVDRIHRAGREMSPDEWPLERLPRRALRRDRAIVYYVSLPHRLELFVATKKDCWAMQLPVSRAALWESVAATFNAIRRAPDVDEDTTPTLPAICGRSATMIGLDRILERLPPSIKHLDLTPDDVLIHMPFAALTVGEKTLAQRGLSLSVVPLPTWTDTVSRRLPRKPHLLAVGFSGGAGEPIDTAAEIAVLHKVLPAARLMPLPDNEASVERVLAALPDATAAHFACHGEFDEAQPDQSGLELAGGRLTVRALRALPLKRLRLAVIGACWGATTKVLPSREMIGLPTTFLENGCSSVIAGLSKLREDAATDVASALYLALRRNDPARALAIVQSELSRGRRPQDWAWLVAFGRGIEPVAIVRVWMKARNLAAKVITAFRGTRLQEFPSRSF